MQSEWGIDFPEVVIDMCGPHGWGMGGWGMMLLMAVFWLLLIVGIVLIIVWLVNRSRASLAVGSSSALDILKERYARGEIGSEEFEKMKREIS